MIQVHEMHAEITFVPFHERRQCQQHMTKDMASPHLSQWRRGRYGKSVHSAELCRFAATVQVNGQCYCRRHAAALVLDLVLSAKEPITMVVRGEQAYQIQDEVGITITPGDPYIDFSTTPMVWICTCCHKRHDVKPPDDHVCECVTDRAAWPVNPMEE